MVGVLRGKIAAREKKPGGKLNSPPGLKLGIVTPKAFGVVIERWALMPLFLRCFFLSCFLFFLCHRLYSPLSIRNRGDFVKSWE
jgi:hypothetical protein